MTSKWLDVEFGPTQLDENVFDRATPFLNPWSTTLSTEHDRVGRVITNLDPPLLFEIVGKFLNPMCKQLKMS